MKTSDLLLMSVENLRRRKFRTLLTVIGVVIGTAAIISMVSLALGIRKVTDDMVSSWGDLTIINVWSGGQEAKLTDKVLEGILDMDGVVAVTPMQRTWQLNIAVYAGKNDRYKMDAWNVVGVYPESLSEFGYNFSYGGPPKDKSKKFFYMVMGSDIPYNFMDTKKKDYNNMISPYPDPITGEIPPPYVDPEKDDFTLKLLPDYDKPDQTLDYDIKIAGILDSNNTDQDTRYTIYMDVRDITAMIEDYYKAQKTKNPEKDNGYDSAKVKVENIKLVGEIEAAINDLGYGTNSLETERQNQLKETESLQIILGALGGVSLLVAAISIANTMVMSVYERTKEIGIMKVLGCFVKDIRAIFLTEAALIGFFGGIIGVILSYIISFAVNYMRYLSSMGGGDGGGGMMGMMGGGGMMGMMGGGMGGDPTAQISIIPLWLVAVGMIFATSIGVLAGFYPASRAVKISALEAIKQD